MLRIDIGKARFHLSTGPFLAHTIAPRSSGPTMWNEFLPISMPTTAIAALGVWQSRPIYQSSSRPSSSALAKATIYPRQNMVRVMAEEARALWQLIMPSVDTRPTVSVTRSFYTTLGDFYRAFGRCSCGVVITKFSDHAVTFSEVHQRSSRTPDIWVRRSTRILPASRQELCGARKCSWPYTA